MANTSAFWEMNEKLVLNPFLLTATGLFTLAIEFGMNCLKVSC